LQITSLHLLSREANAGDVLHMHCAMGHADHPSKFSSGFDSYISKYGPYYRIGNLLMVDHFQETGIMISARCDLDHTHNVTLHCSHRSGGAGQTDDNAIMQ